jgi:hypothetical protein
LGAKKVFNIGVGFYNQPNASLYKTATDSTYQNQFALGVDAFLDMPLNKAKGTALNLLATYYNINYGTNFVRNLGILNEHTNAVPTATSWAGAGNLQPTIGTGSIFYLQAGYLLPKLSNGTSFMPYATATYKKFDRLKDPSTQFGLGINYLLSNHNAKITLEYQTRPIYTQAAGSTDIINAGSKGQLTLQTHIFL